MGYPTTTSGSKAQKAEATYLGAGSRREAMRLLGLIRAEQDPLAERKRRETESRRRGFTVAEVAAEWLTRDQAGHRSLREHRRIVERYILPEIGHSRIRQVRKADILRVFEGMRKTKPVMANRTLARLRQMFRWAMARDLMADDPTSGLEPPRTRNHPIECSTIPSS